MSANNFITFLINEYSADNLANKLKEGCDTSECNNWDITIDEWEDCINQAIGALKKPSFKG